MSRETRTPVLSLEDRVGYARKQLRKRIVHLGFGAFHRAHQAVYVNALARSFGSDWGICAVSLFSTETIKALRLQDHLYTVAEFSDGEPKLDVIGCITKSLHPKLDGRASVLAQMADPDVAIVSLTISEKGYAIDPATGQLDRSNEGVIADLQNPREPNTALGYIVEALEQRRRIGVDAFSVMSCDNIQNNGATTKRAIIEYARLRDERLADWIEENACFPNTMVDRIVPKVTLDTHAKIADLLGSADACAVATEPYKQWVIEDNFTQRPAWEKVGAELVCDVTPYEEMKLRLLNGAHSFLAYLGYLAGYEFISDTMADDGLRGAALDLMLKEQAPSLTMPETVDLQDYANGLIARFSNSALRHETWQIAMDGSQKIPQRFTPSLLHNLENGKEFKRLATGIAAWMIYVSGKDLSGNPIDVRDPMAEKLAEIHASSTDIAETVDALLSIETIFDQRIARLSELKAAIKNAYGSLLDRGVSMTVAEL